MSGADPLRALLAPPGFRKATLHVTSSLASEIGESQRKNVRAERILGMSAFG